MKKREKAAEQAPEEGTVRSLARAHNMGTCQAPAVHAVGQNNLDCRRGRPDKHALCCEGTSLGGMNRGQAVYFPDTCCYLQEQAHSAKCANNSPTMVIQS